ncbi:DUF3054 domain-containing protein [Calidithermus timidus]|jgi:hypothetical protein|uniref:DUF3054 domain-containing protein n=1 Tax=Calidithermus timidus TaxID=307124 RepID=UPI0003A631A6|nr:DUF3054 domain-containing protein [Calidithermus timidus]
MTEPTSTTQPHTNPFGRLLARGDALCLVLFALIGQGIHGTLSGLAAAWRGFLENSLPILVVWFLLAPFLRTYTRPTWRNLLLNWALAVSAGVFFRFTALGKDFNLGFFIFWGVALASTLALLLAWRGLAMLWWRLHQNQSVSNAKR